jgi:dTDP-4-amino-4,6-dideoxygalactose transaminase
MSDKGVMTVFHYQALNTSDVGKRLGGFSGQCPVSESAAQTLVRLPLFTDLKEHEIDQVIHAVKDFDSN